MALPYVVYTITNRTNGRVYVGTTVDLKRRLASHKRKPPRRMVADLGTNDFDALFQVAVVADAGHMEAAQKLEKQHITRFNSRGPNGYNTLKSTPGRSNLFWHMRRKGKLPNKKT